jgi:hypothetical protein
MLVRRLDAWAVLVGTLLIAGCSEGVSHDRRDYVGEYIFTPRDTDIPPSHADLVRLRSDGSGVEIRFDTSGKLSAKETTWSLIDTGTGPGLVIDGFKHTISRRGSVLHLDSNADLNEYYEKVR